MRRTRFKQHLAVIALLALVLALSGCTLRLNNPGDLTPRAPAGSVLPPDTGSGGNTSTTPGYSLGAGGGIATGGGVRLHVSIGEPTSGAVLTGTGVRAQIGLVGVLNGP